MNTQDTVADQIRDAIRDKFRAVAQNHLDDSVITAAANEATKAALLAMQEADGVFLLDQVQEGKIPAYLNQAH